MTTVSQDIFGNIRAELAGYNFNHNDDGTYQYLHASPTNPLQSLVTFLYKKIGNHVVVLDFEVHESLKGQGIGTLAVRQFLSCFPPSTTIEVAVHSRAKVSFWESLAFHLQYPVSLRAKGTGACECCGLVEDRKQ